MLATSLLSSGRFRWNVLNGGCSVSCCRIRIDSDDGYFKRGCQNVTKIQIIALSSAKTVVGCEVEQE